MIETSGYGGWRVQPHLDLMKAEPSNQTSMTYIGWKGENTHKDFVLSEPLQMTMHHGVAIPPHMYRRAPPSLKARFGKVWNEVTMSSSPQRVALAREAAKFFGGIVVPADTDWEKFEVYKRTMPMDGRGLLPDDGEAYDNYQMALFWLKPLFKEDIKAAWKDSGYKREDKDIKVYPVKRSQASAIVFMREGRLAGFIGHGSSTYEANEASKRAIRKLKQGPGKGWWGQPVPHSIAAKKGRIWPSTKRVKGALFSAIDAIRTFEGSGDAEDLEAAVDFMNKAEKLSNSFTEVQTILGARELLMREYLRVSDEDLMDDAIESMYVTGFVDIAHDVERGNLDKALQDISRELSLAEKAIKKGNINLSGFSEGDVKRMRAARKALKALG